MSDRSGAVIHDGQADAMPCQCPACVSPFITKHREHRLVVVENKTAGMAAPDRGGRSSTVSA